jgi:type IV pilus assembly protein PilM
VDYRISAENTLGADIYAGNVKTALLSWKNGAPKIESLQEFQQNSRIYNNDDLGSPPLFSQNDCEDPLIITAIPSRSVLVRPLNLQLTDSKDVDSVLRFQAEPLLPYPIESAVIDHMVLNSNGNSISLTIFAVQNEEMGRHVDHAHSLGFDSEAVSSTPAALASLSEYFAPGENPRFVIHMEGDYSLCAFVTKGKVLASHHLSIGHDHFIDALVKDNDLSPESAHGQLDGILNSPEFNSETQPGLYAINRQFNQELTKIIKALSLPVALPPEKEALVTGKLTPALLSQSELPPLSLPEKYKNFAIAIGLALGHLPNNENLLNFRQESFAYQNPWKRVKRTLVTFGFLCLLLTGVAFVFSQMLLGQHKVQISKKYLSSLSAVGQTYESAEKQIPNGSSLKVPETLRGNALSKRLKFLEKMVRNPSETFHLQPDTPRVCDFLFWLNSHPLISSSLKDDPNSFHLDQLHYVMVSYPQESRPSSPYLLKIELDFRTNSSQFARKFRESLMEPSSFVDSHRDISWKAGDGKYQAIFFIKNQERGAQS